MKTQNTDLKKGSTRAGFIGYASQRLILAVLLIAALIGGTHVLLDHLNLAPTHPFQPDSAQNQTQGQVSGVVESNVQVATKSHTGTDTPEGIVDNHQEKGTATSLSDVNPEAEKKQHDDPSASPPLLEPEQPNATTQVPVTPQATKQPKVNPEPQATQPVEPEVHVAPSPAIPQPAPNDEHSLSSPTPEQRPVAPHPETPSAPPPASQKPSAHIAEKKHSYRPTGVAFVEAVIHPINHELTQRFLGWRPNDIINLTDNANNFQLGVLEVTRRSAVQLTERISRTGSTDSFNQHLQNAMNWLMVKADRYWFPAPESKYMESIEELEAYKQNLINGTASFYTRPDNLIPLLMAFEDLLGSSDENLVKHVENDGSKVSTFKADNYFYYAKGVANAMAGILEAIHHDFEATLESRNGSELLHHAIESCRVAADLDPWFITNSNLDGLLANHRANMAAPISHARFYIGQLIKTLST